MPGKTQPDGSKMQPDGWLRRWLAGAQMVRLSANAAELAGPGTATVEATLDELLPAGCTACIVGRTYRQAS